MSDTPAKKKAVKIGNILLVKSVFTETAEPVENFIGIPTDDSCPFIELIFDPTKKMLGVVSKHVKQQFHYVPRLDGNGYPKANSNKTLAKEYPLAQERILLDTYHEYYIRDAAEIDAFLTMYASNTSFNWKAFLK